MPHKRPRGEEGGSLAGDKRQKQEKQDLGQPRSDSSTNGNARAVVPQYSSSSKSNSCNSSLPPLPPILDSALEKAVFTHPSAVPAAQHNTKNASYEQLEFLGDAYIECIASRIIFEHYPFHTSGKMSQLRESMVKNETLAKYADAYDFEKKMTLAQRARDAMTSKIRQKTLGDIFEAYVAGIVLSHPHNGFSIAEAWLERLWKPIIMQEGRVGSSHLINAKQDLNVKVMGKGIKIEYIEERKPEIQKDNKGKMMYYLGVYLTGWGWDKQYLGSGRGFSKTEAGNSAARAALENHPIIDQIAKKKQDHDAKVKAERMLQDQDTSQTKRNT